MNRPTCIRLRGCYFDEVLCQKLPVSIPQLIAFFGDYPSNIGCDLWQIGFPCVFVRLCHETAHWNSSCPYNNMYDPAFGEDEARLMVHVRLPFVCDIDVGRHTETLVMNGININLTILLRTPIQTSTGFKQYA